MRSDTQTVTIEASATTVYDFLADPENLPSWAIGFAKGIRREEDAWVVTTPQGDLRLQVDTDASRGIVDFVMRPVPDAEVVAYSRVLPNGEGAEYVFTQFQADGMSDETFRTQVDSLAEELHVLKRLLEGR